MKLRHTFKIVFEFAFLLVFLLLVVHRLIPDKPRQSASTTAVTFTLTALNGATIPSGELKGKAVVINFWAPWCPPCRMEIPWLQSLQEDNSAKLRVIGVVADDSQYDNAAAFMKAKGVTYLLAQDPASLQSTFGNTDSLPKTFYISPSGHVVHIVTGLVPEYMMKQYALDAMHQP